MFQKIRFQPLPGVNMLIAIEGPSLERQQTSLARNGTAVETQRCYNLKTNTVRRMQPTRLLLSILAIFLYKTTCFLYKTFLCTSMITES